MNGGGTDSSEGRRESLTGMQGFVSGLIGVWERRSF